MMHNRMLYGYRNTTAIVRDPVTIGTAILTTVGVTGASTLVAGVVGYIATSLVTSWALRALAPKPSLGSANSAGILVNAKDGTAAQEFVYGQIRKGGVVTYYEATGGDNKFLHQIIVLAGHEVDEIGEIYINDEVATFDGDLVTGKYKSKLRIQKFDGTQITVPADLDLESNQIDANFIGRGIAYLYVRYEFDQDVFANGIPLITAVVKGKRVFDPRTGTTAFSTNAALCVRDYLTSAYGMNTADVDDTAFAIAANVCDEAIRLSTIVDAGSFVVGEQYEIKTVGTTDFVAVGASANTIGEVFVATGSGSGTGDAFESEPRYSMNGLARADQKHSDVLANMMTSCAGTLFWGGGKFILRAGAYTAPTKVLTLDDLRSQISIDTRTNLRDQFNFVQGTFNDAGQRWITVDYPPFKSSLFQAEDGGDALPLDLELPMTTSGASAQRIAKLTLFRGREQMTMTADFGLNALDVEVGEIIAFTNPRYGFDQKEFEVIGWRFGPNQDAGDLRITLSLRETSEAAFDWNAEERDIVANNTNLPDPFSAPSVGVSLSTRLAIFNEQVVGTLVIDVTSGSPFVDAFEVQFRRSGTDNFVTLGRGPQSRFEAIGVFDGFYDIRVRAITALGVRGPFNTIEGFFATLFEAPPADVTNFSANVVGNTLHLSWQPVPDLDLSHYKLRYSPLTSSAEYQKSVDLVSKISRPANTATVPAQTGTYFIKAVDKLGNLSQAPASIVIDTNVADIDYLNVVEVQTEHPAFAGAKDGVVASDDGFSRYITLDTSLLFDDALGDFDDRDGIFDSGGDTGFVAPSGIYNFDGYIDLGNRFVSRVTTNLLLDFFDYVNLFDSAPGNFDSREGDFDGDPSQFDTTSVRVQLSTTNDDPAGTPTWSEYRDFIVGDVNARAFRFRAILSSTSSANAPAVRELSVEIDMPDRVEAADDITYTGSQVVTFPAAFNAPPAIGIAASLADGDRYVISAKSRTGFTITTLTGASVSTNPTTIDYVAKGYGKELA